MMGLRAENDHASTNFFSGSQNRKSYRFAEKYHGRFFVSGVSGSFQKYTKQLKETDKKYLKSEKIEKKYTYEPLLEKHQKEELRREALRLLEMEEQLAKLQKMRELKRKRDRERRKKKQEFMSACCIQRCFRAFMQCKRNTSADILVSILRTMYARQSLKAASWASQVIQRFAVKASYVWKERQLRRRRARQLALESWHVIREVASIWTLARRATTDEFVFNCLKIGSQHATQAILDSGAYLRPKKAKRPKKPPVASHKHKKGPKEDHLAFFLTEFDNNDEQSVDTGDEEGSYNGDSEDEDDDDERILNTRKSIKFINKNHSSVEDLTASAQEFLRLSKRQTPAKVYDPNKPDHKRIIEMHKRRLMDFKQERLRRMQAVDQKKDQDEREASERAKAEEAARLSAEQAKKEYQIQLAQEAREKARHEAKLRAEREVLKAKRAAQEKQLLAERSAMQAQDKPQYQNLPAATTMAPGLSKTASKGPRRPMSGRAASGFIKSESTTGITRSNTAEIDTDNENTDSVPVPPRTFVKVKTKPVIDQTAVDAEYYQKALPPKRPHVPRVNTDGAVNKAKLKQLEEQEAIEKEAMIQMEVRRQKYTSEEAVRASRLAVQRRVAAKLERAAQKAKEAETAEVEKKEKMQQVAAIAQERLKADLEKKKKKEADRRAKLGIATPPDFFAIPSVGAAGKHRKPRKKIKHNHPGEESEASASESEPVQRVVSGDSSRGPYPARQSVENKRYAHADSGEDDDNLSDNKNAEREAGGDKQKDEEEDLLSGNESENEEADHDRHVSMGEALSDGDEDNAECSPINPHHESENENNSDSDSLDAMLKGLSHSLRHPDKQHPAPHKHAPSKPTTDHAGSTRSSSAGANDSPTRLTRHTSSGGSDPRLLTSERKNTHSPPSPSAGHAFERADISSAHEHFDDLMENFRADDFFRQSSVVRVLHTNALGELVEGKGGPDKPKKVKTKKLVIPKHLQNTPYFKHYQKHTDGGTESSSATALQGAEGINNGANKKASADETDGAAFKVGSKVPLLARKKQLASELQSAALAGSVSAPVLLDESVMKLQQSHQMKPGKVASLMEMVTKARIKLKNGGTAVDSATEASETETDTEPQKRSHNKHLPAAAQYAHHSEHITSANPHSVHSQHHSQHPSYHSATSTGRVTPQMSYKAATDAELDAFVPSLQPPSVPGALPVPALSFSRKTLGPAGIPLPPLSKDNLTILLKGKDPEALQAQQQNAKPVKKTKKSTKNKDDAKAITTSEKETKLAKKAAVPKTKVSGLTASIAKSRRSLTGRYAHAFEEDGDIDAEDDPHAFSPDQRNPQGVNGNHLYSSQVKFAPEEEAFYAEDDANSDQELEEAEQLQEEYSRLRSEFNAKLQQAAAFNQVRQSQSSQKEAYEHPDNAALYGEGEEEHHHYGHGHGAELNDGDDDDPHAGVAGSGSITQSYSEGIPKISTQDLLRMWAIEDAEEEALRVSESQKSAQPAAVPERASVPTGDVYSVLHGGVAEPSRGEANIRVPSKINNNPANNTTSSRNSGSGGSSRGSARGSARGSGSRYAQYDHQDEASSGEEVEEAAPHRYSATTTFSGNASQRSNPSSAKASESVVAVPIPATTLPADDNGLDDACLSFMNKMATKLPVPKL